jgi:hypothetical protein
MSKLKDSHINDKVKYDMPGQIRETPEELNTLRLFYSSLYEEKGVESKMATQWLLKHGLLPYKLAILLITKEFKIKDTKWDVDKLNKCIEEIKQENKIKTRIFIKNFKPKFNTKIKTYKCEQIDILDKSLKYLQIKNTEIIKKKLNFKLKSR